MIIPSVLIVDDNPADVSLCKMALQRFAPGSFRHFASCSTGSAALTYLQDEESRVGGAPFPPTLLFVDLNMPGLTGFEFLEEFARLRSTNAELAKIGVYVLTASNYEPDRDQVAALGFVETLLLKPPSEEQAAHMLERFGQPE